MIKKIMNINSPLFWRGVGGEAMNKLYIVKIGGNIIDNSSELEKFLADFSKIKAPKILVHGGGKLATELAHKLGISQALVNGRRITDSKTLDVATMVYAGLVNKQIVSSLQAMKINALGLSGADGNSIRSKKRKVEEIDYGFVGDIIEGGINIDFISMLLQHWITPVLSAITHDGKGQLLNTNADTIASQLAIAMSKRYDVELIYCFEKKGVLRNMDDEDSVIETMTQEAYSQLLEEGIISKGMIPKLDNAFNALQNGVDAVLIVHSNQLINAINENEHAGTKLIGC